MSILHIIRGGEALRVLGSHADVAVLKRRRLHREWPAPKVSTVVYSTVLSGSQTHNL